MSQVRKLVATGVKCLAGGQGFIRRRKSLDWSPGVHMPRPCFLAALGCLAAPRSAPGRPFPVPLSQHQGWGKGQVCLCISALTRAFQLSCFSERMHAGVTLGHMLAKQETQPWPHLCSGVPYSARSGLRYTHPLNVFIKHLLWAKS